MEGKCIPTQAEPNAYSSYQGRTGNKSRLRVPAIMPVHIIPLGNENSRSKVGSREKDRIHCLIFFFLLVSVSYFCFPEHSKKIYTLWGLSGSVTLCSRYLFTDFCSLVVSSLLLDGYSSYKESTETKVMAKRDAKHHGGSLGGSFIIT